MFNYLKFLYKSVKMPIYTANVIYGRTGSGKSYYMAKKIQKTLLSGRDVNTTLDIDYKQIASKHYSSLFYKIKKKLKLKNKPLGKLYKINSLFDFIFIDNADVFIDEGHRWFFARDWEKLPKFIPAKIYEHRKYQINIYIGVQDVNSIDVLLRRMADNAIQIKSLFFFQIVKSYEIKDIDKEKRKSKSVSFYLRNPQIFKIYNSFEKNTNFIKIAKENNLKDTRIDCSEKCLPAF